MRVTNILSALLVSGLVANAAAQDDAPYKTLDEAKAEAAKWVPSDKNPMGRYSSDGFIIVPYQYRIEFFPKDSKKPSRVITFKHPFRSFSDKNLLVCTNAYQEYSAQDDHEKQMIALRGGRYDALLWENPKGSIESFCGILSPSGETIFEFPKRAGPKEIYYPIGIAKAGTTAAVFVGTSGPSEHPESEADDVEGDTFNYKEVWIWEAPAKIRKKPYSSVNANGNPLQDLRDGKL